jgi:DNA-directed RNA polymerase specialized sigma24 family protein
LSSNGVSGGTLSTPHYTATNQAAEYTFARPAQTFADAIAGDDKTAHLAINGLAYRVVGSLHFPNPDAKADAASDASLYAMENIATIRSAKNPESMAYDIMRKRMANGLRNELRRKHAPIGDGQEYRQVFTPSLIEVRAAREPHLLTDAAKLRQLNARITKAIKAVDECTQDQRERVEGMVEALQILRRMWYGSYRVCRLSSVRYTKTDRIPLNDN